MKYPLLLIASLGIGTVVLAQETAVEIVPPLEGSISVEAGLDAWSRVYEVTSHPRCANCHTGPSDRPIKHPA